MRTGLSLILLFVFALATAGPSTGPLRAPAVERTLDRKEQELERLYATYWQIQYRLEQGDTGVTDQKVERDLRTVFNDPPFLDMLKAAHFTDQILLRRRQLFLEAAADSQISTNADLAALVESIRKADSATRYHVGGKLLDRPELDNVLGHSADRSTRKEAWFAEADLTRVTGDRIRQLMKLRNQLGPRYGNAQFTDLMLERRATNRRDLANWFAQIRTATEQGYQALLARMQRELRVEKVEPWDLQYYFSTLTPSLESKFGFDGAWERTTKVSARLGFDFGRLPVHVKITDITFGGYTMPIWYGKEIRMLVSKHTGLLFADTILHESGHALHFSFVQEPTFILKDNYPPPMDEGLGQTMSLMLFRPRSLLVSMDCPAMKHAHYVSDAVWNQIIPCARLWCSPSSNWQLTITPTRTSMLSTTAYAQSISTWTVIDRGTGDLTPTWPRSRYTSRTTFSPRCSPIKSITPLT